MNKLNKVATTPLDEWIKFLKSEEINENITAKGLMKTKKMIDILKLDKETMIAYEKDEDA